MLDVLMAYVHADVDTREMVLTAKEVGYFIYNASIQYNLLIQLAFKFLIVSYCFLEDYRLTKQGQIL